MPGPAKTTVEMRDFPGLMTNQDPRDLPPGAGQQQVNAMSVRPGTLEVRPGYRAVQALYNGTLE